MKEIPHGTELPPPKYLVSAYVDLVSVSSSITFIRSFSACQFRCVYICAPRCTRRHLSASRSKIDSVIWVTRDVDKHSITLAGCKFPAHWSSMMPQRSKTDWNLCSYSSISSVTWLCQHLSIVPPNKLLAASFQVFTFAGNNFRSLLLPEVMSGCTKIWSKDLWSSDLSVIFSVKKGELWRDYFLPVVSYCSFHRKIEGAAFRCITRK